MPLSRIRYHLIISLGLGIVIFAAVGIYGDSGKVGSALAEFPAVLLPLVLTLSFCNYALRFCKWQFLLRQLGVKIGLWDSCLIFGSGLAMAATPGKAGELVKSYLLWERTGTEVSRSVPVILVERLTDGLALVLLALAGLALFSIGWEAVVVFTLGASAVIAVVWYRPAAEALLGLAGRLRPIRARMGQARTLYESARTLLVPRNLCISVGLGVVSWGAECAAFWVVLQGLGVPGTLQLPLRAAFIQAVSVLGGSLLTPGGLGVSEGSIAGLSQLLLGLSREQAAAAALLIRACTLWFAIALGSVALLLASRRVARKRSSS